MGKGIARWVENVAARLEAQCGSARLTAKDLKYRSWGAGLTEQDCSRARTGLEEQDLESTARMASPKAYTLIARSSECVP